MDVCPSFGIYSDFMPLPALQFDWSGKPLYSMWVARELGLVKPWEQYGLYMSTGMRLKTISLCIAFCTCIVYI